MPLLQAQRSTSWIAWWSLGTVSSRVLIVWVCNNAGKSVFAASLFHAVENLSWLWFPAMGSTTARLSPVRYALQPPSS